MTSPIPLTISQLTRANYCPASVVESVGAPNMESESSAFGTAVHAVLEEAALHEAPPDTLHHARAHGVDATALADHIENIAFFPRGEPEVKVELLVPGVGPFVDRDGKVTDGVSGTVDLRVIGNDGTATVTDYKSGSPPRHKRDRPIDQWAQGIAYGLATLQSDPFLSSVTIVRYWTQENLEESFVIDGSNKSELEAWIFNLVHRAVESFTKPTYRPIPTWDVCLGCDGLPRCPGFIEKTKRAFALAGEFTMKRAVETPEDALRAWELIDSVKAIKRGADELKKNVLAPYLERHGPVPMGEDTELRLVDHPSGSKYPDIRKKDA